MAYLSLMGAPRLDDFTILRGLGDGSAGTVYLVRENETRGLYALKAIPKRNLCGTEFEIETVMAERNALLDLRGDDFILQLRACFHDSGNYYLVTVRNAFLDSMKTGALYSPSMSGISSCRRSPRVAIAKRLTAECGSVLYGRTRTHPFITILLLVT
jgi:Protein kinase domain